MGGGGGGERQRLTPPQDSESEEGRLTGELLALCFEALPRVQLVDGSKAAHMQQVGEGAVRARARARARVCVCVCARVHVRRSGGWGAPRRLPARCLASPHTHIAPPHTHIHIHTHTHTITTPPPHPRAPQMGVPSMERAALPHVMAFMQVRGRGEGGGGLSPWPLCRRWCRAAAQQGGAQGSLARA